MPGLLEISKYITFFEGINRSVSHPKAWDLEKTHNVAWISGYIHVSMMYFVHRYTSSFNCVPRYNTFLDLDILLQFIIFFGFLLAIIRYPPKVHED